MNKNKHQWERCPGCNGTGTDPHTKADDKQCQWCGGTSRRNKEGTRKDRSEKREAEAKAEAQRRYEERKKELEAEKDEQV